jgi:hypothetical protein
MLSQLPDGTWVEEDAAGNVTIVSGPSGEPVAIDTSILKSFLQDAFGSISQAIRRDFALAPATPAPAAAQASPSAGTFLTPAVKQALTIAAVALVAKKLLFS